MSPLLRRRSGLRLILWLTLALLIFVSAAVAVYQYRRHDHDRQDAERLSELARQPLAENQTRQDDWPQWRGPNRDGATVQTDFRSDWPTDGPPLLWQKPAGESHASVAIVKGRLFTTFREGPNEVIACWKAETGVEIWRYSYPCSYENEHGNGPRATPAVDGELVYAVGAGGMMRCLQAFADQPQGELVWKIDLRRDFNAETPKWGVSFSPLVDGQRVYVQPGGTDGNSLVALDKYTGKLVWRTNDDPASYSSPVSASFAGERQILFFTANRLVSVRPETGESCWDYPWPSDQQCNIATPIVAQDYVFISSGHGPGCAVLKVEKEGDAWRAALVYQHRRMRNHFSTCVRHKDHLYGFDHGVLTCMDFRTGKIHWKERGFDKGTVLLVNDHLVVYGENGIVALAEAKPERYQERSRFTFSTRRAGWSVPVVANGRLYLRDQDKIACFDVSACDR